jgi:hypothetical protein
MGCSDSRAADVSFVEAAIINGENALIFDSVAVDVIISSYAENSSGNEVSHHQLKVVSDKHHLGFSATPPNPKIVAFYDSLKSGDHYNFRELATASVLLSKSSVEAKAKALFKAWTKDKATFMDKENAGRIFDALFNISIHKLPKLILPSDSRNTYTEDELKKYLQRAEIGTSVKGKLMTDLFGTNSMLFEANFVAWFQKPENEKWLNATGVRVELKNIGKSEQRAARKSEVKTEVKVEEKHGKVEVTVEEHHEHHEHHH